MRSDFAVLILTHGRPDRVHTYETLRRSGYSGRILIVIDNEDKTAPEYRRIFGDQVVMFDKQAVAQSFDEGDNFRDRRAIIYARNASFDIARRAGLAHFLQLDDDYTGFEYRSDAQGCMTWAQVKSLDVIFEGLLAFLIETPFASVCIAQGGDYIGGAKSSHAKVIGTKRKAMNTFFCSVDRKFDFVGRINEDVNTYTSKQRAGLPFLTILGLAIVQKQTQSNAGGMTDLYLDSGTYVKSFYSVMYCPSAVVIADMGHTSRRLHHRVNWDHAAPLILRESMA